MLRSRAELIAEANRALADFDALTFSTVAMIPPRLDELIWDDAYFAANRHAIRNASVVNILDRRAITLPCHDEGAAPVGLTLMGAHDDDHRLLTLAALIEPRLLPLG